MGNQDVLTVILSCREALDAPPQSVKAPDASPAIVKPQITKSPSTRTAADVYAMYRLPNDADVGAIIPTPTDAPLDTPRRCGLCGDVYKLSFFKRNSGKLGCASLIFSQTLETPSHLV